ncbi:hypothetical protein CJ030_MR6G010298 [Morella rubra]|uniref:Uncharacterized protein n=1 Tax=Morella rubra TaxID=262757 RepID=A0A6A1VCY1_9ROSI|nr:hypothetical protein CJ030_MR6G010298 [Morella rubra]
MDKGSVIQRRRRSIKSSRVNRSRREGLESTTVAGEEWLENTTVPIGDIGVEDAGGSTTGVEEGGGGSATGGESAAGVEESGGGAATGGESVAGTSNEGADAPIEAEDSEEEEMSTAEHPHQREGELSDAGERQLGYYAQSP